MLQNIIPFTTILTDIQNKQLITQAEVEELVNNFQKADLNDQFFWSINLLSIVGDNP